MNYHEASRSKVCVICSRVATRKKALSVNDIKSLKEFIDNGYNYHDPDYPTGICNGCYLLLNKKRNGHDVTIPINQTYKSECRLLFLRSSGPTCDCSICTIAHSSVHQILSSKKKRGRPKSTNTDETTPTVKAIKVCITCFTKLYPGCRHHCSTTRYRDQKVSNIEKMIATPTSSQRIAARTLRNTKNDECLPTLERSIESMKRPRQLFSADDMSLIRKDLNLSTRNTITLAQDLRKAAKCNPRSVIESCVKEKMHLKNHELDAFFESKTIRFDREIEVKGKKYAESFDQHVITTNKISDLIDKIILHRNLNHENVLVKIGLDGGGGFLKVCLSLFDLTTETTLSSGKTLSKKFKDSCVKKVFIIGITPDVPENYANVKKLWNCVGLTSLERSFSIATDLKLCNILLGLMSHSSSHPCCWCDVDKDNLYKRGTQRTLASLEDLFWKYFCAGSKKDKAKDFGNVIHLPIMENVDTSMPVLDIVPPPELHLMLGPVNHMYDELNKVWLKSEDWLKSCYVKKSDYHGGKFEGNECRKLLKNIDSLENLCPEINKNFVAAFSDFNDVVSSCYGSDLKSNYKRTIAKFRASFLKLNISVTPKVHAVFYHIEEFCALKGMGLGPFSEQTSESIHHEFTKLWENYLIKDLSHPLYAEHLLHAVQMFNSLNL